MSSFMPRPVKTYCPQKLLKLESIKYELLKDSEILHKIFKSRELSDRDLDKLVLLVDTFGELEKSGVIKVVAEASRLLTFDFNLDGTGEEYEF